MPLKIGTQTSDLEKHDYDVNALIFYNNKLYSGADDGKIKIWDENLKLINEITAHESSVFSLAIGEDTLYSCSNDGFVKSWSLESLEAKDVILSGNTEIWKIFFNAGKLYVGDDAGLVRIFNKSSIEGVLEIMHPIVDLLIVGNLVYTSRDLYIIISEVFPDQKRISTIRSIEGKAPTCVVSNKLCFPSRSGRDINVHDNTKQSDFKEIGKIVGAHEMIINALCEVRKNDSTAYLCSGGWDKIAKIWKIDDDLSNTVTDSCQVSIVINALTAGLQNQIFAGGSDGHIIRIDML